MNLKVEDECRKQYENLKYRKTEIRYIIYKINKEEIGVEKVGPKEENWNSFLFSLPSNEFRFAVFDFEFKNADNMSVSKLVFISWNPDTSPLKGRMLYATGKQSFKKYLDLNTRDFTICSTSEMTEEEMIKEISK